MASPIKSSFKTELFPLLIILISIIASFFFYQSFPEQVATNWNIAGEADAWSSRAQAAFMMPAVGIFLYLMFVFIPRIDPKKERYEQFSRVYHIFKSIIILFLVLIYFVSSLSAIGFDIDITRTVTFFVGILFIVLGNYMSKIKMNWFIGIRTPWTLSSEEVWNQTHRVGGKLFMFSGIIMMVIGYVPIYLRLPLLLVIILTLSLGTLAYSYYLFNQEQKQKNGSKYQ